MQAGPSYTVLRIKRKATDQPLSSLVIQDQDSPSLSGPTKRQRNVSYRRKMGVFKLADTVPDSWIGRGAEGEVLKERIMGLLGTADDADEGRTRDRGKGKEREADVEDEEAALNEPSQSVQSAYAGGGDASGGTSAATLAVGPSMSPSDLPPGLESQIQYRVIPSAAEMVARAQRKGRNPMPNGMPPKVMSWREVEAQSRSPFRFIDAQAVSRAAATGGAVGQEEAQAGKRVSPEIVDPQMAAFEGMLQEYLTLERDEAARKEAEEEYVYDLYYRDISGASVVAARTDGAPATAIGALIGFDDLSPPSTPSSSEPEDEADEDSNDENDYRNDYPEDEDADSDMEGYEDAFGDDSDEDGSEISGASGGSDEDRGKWGYR